MAAGSALARPDSHGAGVAKKPGPLAALIKKSKTEDGLVFYGNPPTANFKALRSRCRWRYDFPQDLPSFFGS